MHFLLSSVVSVSSLDQSRRDEGDNLGTGLLGNIRHPAHDEELRVEFCRRDERVIAFHGHSFCLEGLLKKEHWVEGEQRADYLGLLSYL